MFSSLSLLEKRQFVLKLQEERKMLKVKAKTDKLSRSTTKKPKQKKPVFENPDIEKIFNSMPSDFQKYLQSR